MNWKDKNIVEKFRNYSVFEYFKHLIPEFDENLNLEILINFLSEDNQSRSDGDEKLGFKREILKTPDTRFNEIFINYHSEINIDSIVWFINKLEDFSINLAQLKELFGNYNMRNLFYDETTEFVFKSQNPIVQFIRTSHGKWLREENSIFKIEDEKTGKVIGEILNPKFHSLTIKFKKIE